MVVHTLTQAILVHVQAEVVVLIRRKQVALVRHVHVMLAKAHPTIAIVMVADILAVMGNANVQVV